MSFMKIRAVLAGLVLLALVACGGGGGGISAAGTSVLPGTGAGTGTGNGTGSGGATTSSATVAVAVSSNIVTAASPATVTITVRDASGNPIANTVVSLTTQLGSLGNLSVPSVATNSSGSATALLSAASAGLSGSDQVVAVALLGTTTVQGTAAFTVAGSVPSIGLVLSAQTLRVSTGAVTAKAVLLDAAGKVVANQVISFASGGGFLTLSAPSAVTDGFGAASINIQAANAAVTAADTLVASATVNGVAVQSIQALQVQADTGSVLITAGQSNVASATQPATLSILVKDSAGVPVGAGSVVTVSSSFDLSAFNASTAATNASGVATVLVTPKTATSSGADQIVATVAVGTVQVVSPPFYVQIVSSTSTAPPVLTAVLSSSSLSSAAPATFTATLTDSTGAPVAGQVVTFKTVLGLASTNVATALTNATGKAVVILSPASSSVAGADQVTASVSYGGNSLLSTQGFQIQATDVALTSLTSAVASLGAYGQTTLTLSLSGASVGSPVNIGMTSSCVSQGKATLSPLTFSATTNPVSLQYKDNGCGALQGADSLQATIAGTASSAALSLPIAQPAVSSLAFVNASQPVIYIKGSGFVETSTLSFQVQDSNANPLPNVGVTLTLLTLSGGLTIGGLPSSSPQVVTQNSDASGNITVQVNSGSVPTPVRVAAALTAAPSIATVSSNLSVAVGLPSQLNFSLAQKTRNIEGFNIDGIPNSYTIIASDRSGNPVPNGTSINFVTEGGQIQPIVSTTGSVSGSPVSATATAAFQSASPRPADGRVTITAYALGEESFIDQNGNNAYDPGEPFQDLGNLFKDRNFDGSFDTTIDEFVPTNVANASACLLPALSGAGATSVTSALLALDPSIPSVGASTCDGVWSGAGKVYVRRATETVLSTSSARALWASKSGLDSSCSSLMLQTGPLLPAPLVTSTFSFTPVQGGETWYGSGGISMTLPFIVADANTFPTPGPNGSIGRLNPMAAGTTVSVSTPTTGLKVTLGGGTPVASTTEATSAAVGVTFDTVSAGVVYVTFTSPGGLATVYTVNVQQSRPVPFTACS
jgi:hypothetical protein